MSEELRGKKSKRKIKEENKIKDTEENRNEIQEN